MACGALMVFVTRPRNRVPLWIGGCLACVAASLLLAGTAGRTAGMLALAFLAAFLAEVRPGPWQRRAAVVVSLAVVAAALAGAQAFAQGLAAGVAVWSTLLCGRLVRTRHTSWPFVIALIGLTYPVLTLGLFDISGLEGVGFIAYVLAPGVVLTRRAIRAFDAEERRSFAQAKFTEDLVDSLPVALAMRDAEGRYLFVNRTWEKLFGDLRESVVGQTLHERVAKDVADEVASHDRAALERGPNAAIASRDFSFGGKQLLQTRAVMADAHGKPVGVLVATVDRSESHGMQQALAAEQRRFELVVRAANVGILDWDGLKRSAWYSPRFKEILRYPPDADTSAWPDYFEIVHPEDRERVQARFREHILTKGGPGMHELHEPIEYRLLRSDGSYVRIAGPRPYASAAA